MSVPWPPLCALPLAVLLVWTTAQRWNSAMARVLSVGLVPLAVMALTWAGPVIPVALDWALLALCPLVLVAKAKRPQWAIVTAGAVLVLALASSTAWRRSLPLDAVGVQETRALGAGSIRARLLWSDPARMTQRLIDRTPQGCRDRQGRIGQRANGDWSCAP